MRRRSASQTGFFFTWEFGQMLSFSFSFSFCLSSRESFVKPGRSEFEAVPNTPQACRSDWPGASTGGKGQGRYAECSAANFEGVVRTSKSLERVRMQRQISGDVGRSGDACS